MTPLPLSEILGRGGKKKKGGSSTFLGKEGVRRLNHSGAPGTIKVGKHVGLSVSLSGQNEWNERKVAYAPQYGGGRRKKK